MGIVSKILKTLNYILEESFHDYIKNIVCTQYFASISHASRGEVGWVMTAKS